MRNKSGNVYTVESIYDVRSTFYTGANHRLVKKDRQARKVAPKSGLCLKSLLILNSLTNAVSFAVLDDELILQITYDDYANLLVDQSSFTINVLATVVESSFQYHGADDFRVRMPDILFEVCV